MKTPIRDNLNFKSLSFIKKLIPENSIVNSFLLYSGTFDCELARDKRYVMSHTAKYHVYEFWNCILEDPKRVADNVKYIYKMLSNNPPTELKKLLVALQKNWNDSPDYYARAAYFFLLNQMSDNGSISCGKLNLKNFNPISLHTLRNFKIKNLHLSYKEGEEFLETLTKQESDFLLLPVGNYSYNLFEEGKNRGHETTTIYHKQLFNSLVGIDTKWVVVYKKHLDIFNMYGDYNLFMVDKHGRHTIKKNNCEDIIIANF